MNIRKNIEYIKKELFNILKAINDDVSDSVIYDSYEDYNKSMLDFLKSRDKIWVKGLIALIKTEIANKADKNSLNEELLSYRGQNKYFINYVVSKIFDDDIIENESISDELDDKDKEIEIQIEEVIKKIAWRNNQLDAINRSIRQGFLSGVHNQIMGAGKTFIILNTIYKHWSLNKNKKLYIITTDRQEILRDLCFDCDGDEDENKKKFFRMNDIIDFDKFKIINKLNFIKEDGKKVSNKVKESKFIIIKTYNFSSKYCIFKST